MQQHPNEQNQDPGNQPLPFEFTVDKAAKTVLISRVFDAGLSLVWDAFTTAELLDQWTAPAPFSAKTIHMNFEVGGKRFYAMVGPDGQERYVLQTYTAITPQSNIQLFNVFADKDETPELHGSSWNYQFSEQNGMTTVKISIFNESFDRMEQLLEGFKQGFTMTLSNLDNLLKRGSGDSL
jgi:uncharacterized protein YndB with AHSA1/START domain